MAKYSDHLDDVFQALADPTRRAVIGRLGIGPASVSELAEPFDMALPSFMKHIRSLEASGWVITQKTGRVRTCALRRDPVIEVETWLSGQRRIWDERTDRLEQYVTTERTQP
jgi:DNA-binding transcriptional ArsR family regulator